MLNMVRQLIDYAIVRSGLVGRQRGATLVEYALIVALIAVAVLIGGVVFSDDLTSVFGQVETALGGGTG